MQQQSVHLRYPLLSVLQLYADDGTQDRSLQVKCYHSLASAGDSQGEDSSQKSSRSTSISTSGEVGGMESRREDKRGKGSSMRGIASETEGDKADARAVRMLCHNLAAWHAGNSRVWDLLRRG